MELAAIVALTDAGKHASSAVLMQLSETSTGYLMATLWIDQDLKELMGY